MHGLRLHPTLPAPRCCRTPCHSLRIDAWPPSDRAVYHGSCAGWLGAGALGVDAASADAGAQSQAAKDTWRAVEALLRLTGGEVTLRDSRFLPEYYPETYYTKVRTFRAGQGHVLSFWPAGGTTTGFGWDSWERLGRVIPLRLGAGLTGRSADEINACTMMGYRACWVLTPHLYCDGLLAPVAMSTLWQVR